ncbi:MAG: hypothetical protein ACE5JR_08130 [Gemmatimonadota bacterium]
MLSRHIPVRRWSGFWLAVALAACRESSDAPERTGSDVAEPEPNSEITPAVYRTSLTFAGFGPEPTVAHLVFENRTGASSLRRAYRGWLARGESWQTILSLRDSLPLPRAAWRVLPQQGLLRVHPVQGGELGSVRIGAPDGPLRLDGGPLIADWIGSTGWRETMRAASLSRAGVAEPGLLLARRSAWAATDTVPPSVQQYFVLVDSVGDGLLLLRGGVGADAPATAWTWLEGLESEWPDAVVRSLAAPPGSAGRWSVQLPDAGIIAELEGGPLAVGEPGGAGEGLRVFRTRGTFLVAGVPRRLAGIGVEDR